MNTLDQIYGAMGLSDTEKAIMEATAEARNVQDIASGSGVSRTGVNYCLSSLLRRGLARIIRNGKKRLYLSLTEPELVEKLQQVIDEAKIRQTDKKGARVKTTREDEFIIHIGTREIIPAYKRIASENKNERILAIQHHRSYNELLEKITPKQLISFNETIIKNHLIIDGMLNEGAYQAYKEELRLDPKKYGDSLKSLEGRMADYTLFTDKVFNHDAELWLFKNTSLLINWHEEVAIEITNRSMTAFLRDMFEFVKKDGKRVDHNLAMRNILKKDL
jgi:sugar-specific transcriptional regulator TrmB